MKCLGMAEQPSDASLAIVMILCNKGDLKGHTYDGRYEILEGSRMCHVAHCEMILITLEMLLGVAYIHNDIGMIHRDLAARNIMLTMEKGVLVAQLADLGMSHIMEEGKTYYGISDTRAKLPLQHCAPQLLEKKVGAKKKLIADKPADMWALGVTMFEMLTNCSGGRGAGPYLEEGTILKANGAKLLADITDIRAFITTTTSKSTGIKSPGERLHIPESCPAELRVLMEALWSNSKKDRPTALQCIFFLLRACAPLLGEARLGWEPDAESAAKIKAWIVDNLGIPVPRPQEMFEMFNYECLVDDDNLRDDIKTELGDVGSEFVLGETFQALHREIKALEMLNKAVEQEPLKSALAVACEQAVNEKGGKKMQAKLDEALLQCDTGSGFTAGQARRLIEEEGKRRQHDEEVETARSAAVETEQALVGAANVAREEAEKEERNRVEAAEVARVTKVEEEQNFASEVERTRVAAEEEERRRTMAADKARVAKAEAEQRNATTAEEARLRAKDEEHGRAETAKRARAAAAAREEKYGLEEAIEAAELAHLAAAQEKTRVERWNEKARLDATKEQQRQTNAADAAHAAAEEEEHRQVAASQAARRSAKQEEKRRMEAAEAARLTAEKEVQRITEAAETARVKAANEEQRKVEAVEKTRSDAEKEEKRKQKEVKRLVAERARRRLTVQDDEAAEATAKEEDERRAVAAEAAGVVVEEEERRLKEVSGAPALVAEKVEQMLAVAEETARVAATEETRRREDAIGAARLADENEGTRKEAAMKAATLAAEKDGQRLAEVAETPRLVEKEAGQRHEEAEAAVSAAAEHVVAAKEAASADKEYVSAKLRVPETALRAFAESVGMGGDMWQGVKRGKGGEIVKIDWKKKGLRGTLPVGDLNMPSLKNLDLSDNGELKGDLAALLGVAGLKELKLSGTKMNLTSEWFALSSTFR